MSKFFSSSDKSKVSSLTKDLNLQSHMDSYHLIPIHNYMLDPSPRLPDPPQDFGEDLFDPTGFVPLEVMIKQQELAGRKALIQRSMFDFEDWKDIYLNTEAPADFEDDFQVMEYIREVERKKDELFKERQKELNKEFAEFLSSKRKQNATTTINDDDANTSSKTESQTSEQNTSTEE